LKCVPHFSVSGGRVLVEQRFGRHHPAVQAVAALECLFRNERRLNRMRPSIRLQAFERDDFLPDGIRHGQLARPNRAIIDQHSARPALPDAAAKSRIDHFQMVSKDIQEWTFRVRVYLVYSAIHFQGGNTHKHLTIADCITQSLAA
jgi:hypothetical protein